MNLEEYTSYDGCGLVDLVRTKAVSARELAEIAMKAIDRLDPQLNCMTTRTPALAEAALAELDCDAPFAGLPFLMKEGHGVAGQPAVMASRLARGVDAKSEAEIVRRYRRGGLVLLGCTNVPEFGTTPTTESALHGPARNPWNLDLTPGGSSGGAAAAVAAGIVPVAHASDGGGSIRIPAHCCGLVGLKPTRGRTPVGPAYDGWPFGYGVQHVVSRTVRDSAAMLDLAQGYEDGSLFHVQSPEKSFAEAARTVPRRLRIAYLTDSPDGTPVHPECVLAIEKTVRLCSDLGHALSEGAPPLSWQEFVDAFAIGFAMTRQFFCADLEQKSGLRVGPDTVEPINLAALDFARGLTLHDVARAAVSQNNIRRRVATFFADYDVLLTPMATRPAWRLGELSEGASAFTFEQWGERMLQYVPFTQLYNATGQPAIAIPLHQSADNLPVGVQFVGRFGDEATLLSLAAQLEQAQPWIDRRPPVHYSR